MMAKSHCSYTFVSIVSKNCVFCVKLLQVNISASSWKNKDIREPKTLTHNHNRLMGIIIFGVHPITPTSLKHACNHIKSILILFAFSFSFDHNFAYIYFKHNEAYHAWIYRREKRKYPLNFLFKHHFLVVQVLCLTDHGFFELDTGVYEWLVLVVA